MQLSGLQAAAVLWGGAVTCCSAALHNSRITQAAAHSCSVSTPTQPPNLQNIHLIRIFTKLGENHIYCWHLITGSAEGLLWWLLLQHQEWLVETVGCNEWLQVEECWADLSGMNASLLSLGPEHWYSLTATLAHQPPPLAPLQTGPTGRKAADCCSEPSCLLHCSPRNGI